MIKEIDFFEVVYRLGGIRASKEELNVSNSTLTRVIQNLENSIEQKLFMKIGEEFIATHKADYLYKKINKPIDEIRGVINSINQDKNHYTVLIPEQFSLNFLNEISIKYKNNFNEKLSLTVIRNLKNRGESYKKLRTAHVDIMFDFCKPKEFRFKSQLIFKKPLYFFTFDDLGINYEYNGSYLVTNWLGEYSFTNYHDHNYIIIDSYRDLTNLLKLNKLVGIDIEYNITTSGGKIIRDTNEYCELHIIYDTWYKKDNKKLSWIIDEIINVGIT